MLDMGNARHCGEFYGQLLVDGIIVLPIAFGCGWHQNPQCFIYLLLTCTNECLEFMGFKYILVRKSVLDSV